MADRRSWIRVLSLSLALGPLAYGGEPSKGEGPSSTFKAKVSGAESFEARGNDPRSTAGRRKLTSSGPGERLVVQLRTAHPEESFGLVFGIDVTGRASDAEVGSYTLQPLDAVGQWIRSGTDTEFYSDKGTLEVKESNGSHLRGTFDVSGKCGKRREACRIEGEFDVRREKPTPDRPT
jgi:hypothetical protein